MGKIRVGLRLSLIFCALATGGAAASQDTPSPPQAAPAPAPPTAPALSPPPAPAQSAQPVVAPPAQPVVAPLAQPPAVDQPPPLPPIPPAPQATLPPYPECKDAHATIRGRVARATRVRSCIVQLDDYEENILQVFARRMAAHRDALWGLWEEVNRGPYSRQQKREFYDLINIEFGNAQPEGSYLDQYRATSGRYVADREYLRTEFCNLVRCAEPPR